MSTSVISPLATQPAALVFVTNRGPGTFYNASDLNRVEQNVQAIAELLDNIGYHTGVITRQWNIGDFPDEYEMTRYLSNIRALRDAYAALPDTPDLPADMHHLTYQGANDIERVLLDIYMLICNAAADYIRCSETFSGEDDFI